MCEWSFLTNHFTVLSQVARQPGSTIRQIAPVTGVSDTALRRIIADLINAGYVTKKREGRQTQYSVSPDLSLHRNRSQESDLMSFLEALGWQSD